jgi:hypothetical protein
LARNRQRLRPIPWSRDIGADARTTLRRPTNNIENEEMTMSEINGFFPAMLARGEAKAAAEVRSAMAELAHAATPGAKLAAQAHLHKAEDRFVKADAALHKMQAHRAHLNGTGPEYSAAYYQKVARHDLAKLERSGYAHTSNHVACPHYASPEARQRATLGGLLSAVKNLDSQIENLMKSLAARSTSPTSSASGTTAAGNDLAEIANNPSLNIEDKIALFMSKYIEKNNQELNDKMKELAAAKNGQTSSSSGATETSSSSKTGGGSVWSKISGFFKKVGGALPDLAKKAAHVIGGLNGGPAGAAINTTLGTNNSSSTSQANGTAPKDTTTLETELQMLTQKREQLVKMLTDLMAALHRTTMSVVNNIKP